MGVLVERWIGLRDVANNQFNWIDDGTEPVYINWMSGNPTDDLQDCVFIKTSQWSTKLCSNNIQFICEKGKIIYRTVKIVIGAVSRNS